MKKKLLGSKLLGLILAMVMIITYTVPSYAFSNNRDKMIKIETEDKTYDSLDQMENAMLPLIQETAGEYFSKCETPSITFNINTKVKCDEDPVESGTQFTIDFENKDHYHREGKLWSGNFLSTDGWETYVSAETNDFSNGIWDGNLFVRVDYDYTYAQRITFWNKFNTVLESLDLDGKSDYEKTLAIYRWVTGNVEYEKNTTASNQTAYSALVNGEAVCNGFATLLECMLNAVGVDCIYAGGVNPNSGIGHAWNLVKLNNQYYLCDPTSDRNNIFGEFLTEPNSNGNFDVYVLDTDTLEYQGVNFDNLNLATQNYTDQIIGRTDEITNQENCQHNFQSTDRIIPPTCTARGYYEWICSKCGKVSTINGTTEAALGHNYQTVHKEPTCTEQGGDYQICSRCGKVKTIENPIPATGHTHTGEGTVLAKACCGQKGLVQYTCAICNETYEEETPAGEHTDLVHEVYKEATCQEKGLEWDWCYGCWTALNRTTIPKIDHDYVETIVKEPTYTEKGLAKYTCSMCRDTYTEEIPVLTCKHETTEIRNQKKETCETDGYTGDTVCTKCGKIIKTGETVKATGHKWDNGTITIQPDCTNSGEKTYICTVCYNTKTEIVDPLGHLEGESVNAKEATCTEDGYTGDVYCDRCHDLIQKGETIPQTGHQWNDGIVIKEATCLEEGKKEFTCTVCANTKTEPIKMLGHVKGDPVGAKEATCTEDGYTGDFYCTRCSVLVETGKVIPKTGHTWDDGEIIEKATCSKEGKKKFTCVKCTATKTESIPKTDHLAIMVQNERTASCLEEGYTGDEICLDCGETVKKGTIIPKTDHTWDGGVVTSEPTYTNNGVKTYTCAVCQTTKTESIPKLNKPSNQGNTNTANGNSTVTQKPTIKVRSIALNGISKKIAAGKSVKLNAEILPENAANKGIRWISSNNKVATVTQSGLVKVNKKAGGKSVIITALASDGSGERATYKIKVMKGVVKKVSTVGSKSKVVKAGKSLKLKAKVSATAKANKKLIWTSNNEKYATVKNGKIKTFKSAKGKKVKITVMATDGSNKKATYTIKIK